MLERMIVVDVVELKTPIKKEIEPNSPGKLR